jgi:4-amino-4-deoxy-L-arabinose transferase-like glycosyltransferase
MLLVFFSTLGVYLFLIERFTLGWLALGLAFLAKGPVGVVLPVGVYYVWKLSQKGNFKEATAEVIRNLIEPKGLILFLLVGSSWYLMMLYKFGWDYFYAFFVQQNIDRFLGKLGAHRYPFWYYIPIVLTSIVLFLPLIPRIVKNFDKKLIPPLAWFLLVFLFYSISREKLHHYILFAYPPLALIFAKYLTERYLKVALTIGVAGILALTTAAYLYEKERFTPKAVDYLKKVEPKRLVFFRDENSALVFYLYRCIPNKDKLSEIPPKTYLVTKEKYIKLLEKTPETYYLILSGKEFGKKREFLFFKE